MKIEPAGHRVLVKPDPVEEVSKSGIILVHEDGGKRQQDAQARGTIIHIGPNAWKAYDDGTPWAAVGDKIWFAKYGGFPIQMDGEYYRIINDEDVCAIERQE